MNDAPSLLDGLVIESPCGEPWDAMKGDDQTRHCAVCRLDVHDLSTRTRADAESFLQGASGRLCVRLHRRPDGRVLTQDCAPARRAVTRRRTRVRVLLAGLLALLGGTGCRQADRGEVLQGVVVPECYETLPDGVPPEGPAPVPPRGGEGAASCG